MRTRRIATVFLCALFIIVIAFPGVFITIHTRHGCAGKDCPVCAAIESYEVATRLFAILLAFAGVARLSVCVARPCSSRRNGASPLVTLVSMKVKLTD
ncbi:MAG: hypothetical protein Q4D04_12895 [Clostridia bacterium]|nr:hypothetical protein [Clostridia bacterium]